jgi:hypothetical protein
MCTYLHEYEYTKFASVEDEELNELFQEVRQKFGNRHYLNERKFPVKVWKGLRRVNEYVVRYDLYVASNLPEVQVVNFATEGGSSISGYVSKSYIYAYFYGLLSGLRYAEIHGCNTEQK